MMHVLRLAAAGLALLLAAPSAIAQRAPHPLFAEDGVIQFTLSGPIRAIARSAERSEEVRDAMLMLGGAAPETHAIRLSARGITRRRRDICTFPPLRIEFASPPAQASLFTGQRRLKLVTHCRSGESFQQYVLLEYAAYRLLNALTPLSLRVRLARIDYVDEGGERPFASRLGFLIEDIDDAARRNGMVEVETGNFPVARLSARDAGRFAVFQYMVGNVDWAMHGGPPGDDCCHNSRPIAAAEGAAAGLIPIPYDFDHAGLVDAPYATLPPQVPGNSVRRRHYRGFCMHNEEARRAAGEMLAARAALMAVLADIPELEERTRGRASSYLADFFEDVASPESIADRLFETCLR